MKRCTFLAFTHARNPCETVSSADRCFTSTATCVCHGSARP